jgi:hypothetical protein
MKTLLRKIPDGQFLQSTEAWTSNPSEALDFKSMSHAIEFVEQTGYRNMEVAFVSENPRRMSTVRVDTLEGLEQ